jgi:zinc transport system substrate-binding protein
VNHDKEIRRMLRCPLLGGVIIAGLGLGLLAGPAAAKTLKVTVTIKPIHALVAEVMAGRGAPDLLVRGNASPHTYALKPSDARTLNDSDIVFRVSETVEPFTRKIVASLPATARVVTLADAPGIALLDVREGGTFEAHAHEHAAGEHHEETEEHEKRDGHVWLDPENAIKMVNEIARVLAEADPDGAETYATNAARATAGLDALETEISRELEPVRGRPYVVFHDAYQYFERRFDLAAVGSITVSPEAQPSARRLTEIRRKLATLSAACVFAEPQFQPKLVAAVTEGTSARSGTLDPEGALLEPGPGAYATLMRNLAASLKSCLSKGG